MNKNKGMGEETETAQEQQQANESISSFMDNMGTVISAHYDNRVPRQAVISALHTHGGDVLHTLKDLNDFVAKQRPAMSAASTSGSIGSASCSSAVSSSSGTSSASSSSAVASTASASSSSAVASAASSSAVAAGIGAVSSSPDEIVVAVIRAYFDVPSCGEVAKCLAESGGDILTCLKKLHMRQTQREMETAATTTTAPENRDSTTTSPMTPKL
ncbi:hypothetical protein Pelo_1743 [Pelomyxa schiedti]|nr:hypothetical protein Pelo_1743 [Pelomyxa schiedti]